MSSSLISSVFGALQERLQLGKRIEALWPILTINWYLGFTAFGGPPVHFQIFHKKYVEKLQWIDEQIYQEIFGICQATPGPGSTKMLFNIIALHSGWLAGIFAFLIWSLPGALGMYGLSLGVARINEVLPGPVYALLTGLNAATVGIIALAAVQLAEKAITDKLTRVIVAVGGCAGILYNALWYFPVLLVAAGTATLVWDFKYLQRLTWAFKDWWRKPQPEQRLQARDHGPDVELQNVERSSGQAAQDANRKAEGEATSTPQSEGEPRTVPASIRIDLGSWKTSVLLIGSAVAMLVVVLTLRGVLTNSPRGLSIYANLYLAGTIIFGGGPVVIPLLRTYVVAEGWVSSRDFLLGLAIIQAFPGPNFNFAVYLGALSAKGTSLPSAVGGLVGYLGIFAPGLLISAGLMGIWTRLRLQRWLKSFLRGVNALAVGLVFTAVYRLWQIGYIDAKHNVGQPLGNDAWWVVVTAISFVTGRWFALNPAAAILLGGAMGVLWYGVVKA